jgi:hypothetical protein
MDRTIRMFALCSMIILSGCASHYVYQGELSALDSASHVRTFLVYWTRTERPLWFDTAEGGVRLLTECSLNDLYFKEQENGIIFERREGDRGVGRGRPPQRGLRRDTKRQENRGPAGRETSPFRILHA